MNESLSQRGYGVLMYQGRLYVTHVDDLKSRILEEDHEAYYSIHPGSTKM